VNRQAFTGGWVTAGQQVEPNPYNMRKNGHDPTNITRNFLLTDGIATVIQAFNLRKSYGTICAVDDLSFDIQAGETFGLLGPNGAGKSTTIGMLIGLVAPDAGDVRVGSSKPTDAATRMRIGLAPQTLSLYDELTAQENLAFFGRLYGLRGGRLADRVAWGLRLSGLSDRAKHRVGTFSGGMKRRLNIAVGLIHNPQVLLLDEPTVGVDPQSRNHIFDTIEQLSQAGLTILYTTHYMEEAERLCDRVAIMDKGRLLALDTVSQLIRQHGGDSQVVADMERWPDEPTRTGTRDGNELRFSSDRPLDEVLQLSSRGARFHSLQINSPSLESVFLSLTGRSLRD
jgi:ABC-2 type transport system ATP-binding protein